MFRKKSFCIIITIALISIFTHTEKIKNNESIKNHENIWHGKMWDVILKTIDINNNNYTLIFKYNGELKDLHNIRKISFAVGSENNTQILNTFDISLPDQKESYVDEYKSMGILFLDFKNLKTTNLEIEFNGPKGDGELLDLFQQRIFIEICWGYSFDTSIEKKDSISIN